MDRRAVYRGVVPEALDTVTLAGRHVRLEPLTIDHADELTTAAEFDRSTFDLTWVPGGGDAMRDYIESLLAGQAAAEVLPFAQRRLDTGEVVGCTRYLDPHWWRGRPEPDEIEIGGTWLGAAAQRTAVNTEAKLLLLEYAFDVLDVWRVAICTDARNQRSRAAIERIGASFEGVLRNHRLVADADRPSPRQTAVYSIIDNEWPDVKRVLEARLEVR
jgi:RimJ/RimL family protein N-acetyltransferase